MAAVRGGERDAGSGATLEAGGKGRGKDKPDKMDTHSKIDTLGASFICRGGEQREVKRGRGLVKRVPGAARMMACCG